MKQHQSQAPEGHVCLLYTNQVERMRLVAEYFQTGLKRHELCIFVTPDSTADIRREFQTVGFDAGPAIERGDFRLFEMDQTYLPDGRFVANYMLGNVRNFLRAAKSAGYNGLRTAGEMGWLGDHPESLSEAVVYEEQVNRLGSPNCDFIGLCMYPVHDTFMDVLQQALPAHPTIAYHGNWLRNPDYKQPAAET